MNKNYSLRESIADAIVNQVKQVQQPRVSLVTREPFEVDRIAITDFPAVLVQLDLEERMTMTMGDIAVGRRAGTMEFTIRGYVRGVELDQKRNELITGIEQALDADRYLGLKAEGVTDSQIIKLEVIKRLPPLAEIHITFEVKYNYLRTKL